MKNIYKDLFLLDPEIIFLNHGSFGATPKPVFDVYQSWQRRLERQPVMFLGREFDSLMYAARKDLGDYLNAKPEDLVFVPNATYGVNVVVKSLNLKVGDEILTTDHEYGACDYTWEYACKNSGAIYIHRPVNLPLQPEVDLIDDFMAGVTPKTKVIYLSHITSPTALILPVAEICKRAKNLGIITVVDGAHVMGQMNLNLAQIGADFYTGNCHKWSLAPKGSGFLYVSEHLQGIIEPLVISWGYGNDPQMGTGSRYVDIMQWTGTRDPAAFLSVPAAIQFLRDNNWDEVRRECHQLLKRAIGDICDLTGLVSAYPLDSDVYIQMGVAPLPERTDLLKLKKRLYDEFKVEVPLTQHGNQKFVRISVQAYNTAEDINSLLEAMRILLPQVEA